MFGVFSEKISMKNPSVIKGMEIKNNWAEGFQTKGDWVEDFKLT